MHGWGTWSFQSRICNGSDHMWAFSLLWAYVCTHSLYHRSSKKCNNNWQRSQPWQWQFWQDISHSLHHNSLPLYCTCPPQYELVQIHQGETLQLILVDQHIFHCQEAGGSCEGIYQLVQGRMIVGDGPVVFFFELSQHNRCLESHRLWWPQPLLHPQKFQWCQLRE